MTVAARERVGARRLIGRFCGSSLLAGAILLTGCGPSTPDSGGASTPGPESIVPPGDESGVDAGLSSPAPDATGAGAAVPGLNGLGVPEPGAVPPADAGAGSSTQLVLPPDFDPNRLPPADADSPKPSGFVLPPTEDSSALPATANGVRLAAFSPNPQAEAESKSEVVLKAATWEAIAEVVAKTNRITVVDLWSLACEPCLKEFPGLVELDQTLGKQVACLSVNVDFDGRRTKPAESYRPRVEAFLASVEAKFPNYLCETPSDEVFEAVQIDSIPAVMIFDASGKLIRTFSDVGEDAGFTYEKNILPLVKRLVRDAS